MFERYTDRARRAVTLTMQAQADMGHPEADTGHLLVGLSDEGGGVAFRALTALGVTRERVREAVWGRHPGLPGAAGGRRFGARLGKALELAARESARAGVNYVGTEHLLLGLIAEGEDVGALALSDCGGGDPAFPAEVRAKVLELLRGYAAAEAARNVTPRAYPAVMTEDPGDGVASLLPDIPEPPSWHELLVTIPNEDDDRALPLAPGGGAVRSEITLRMPLRAKTLSEAMILAAAMGGWTKVPGARAEVRPVST